MKRLFGLVVGGEKLLNEFLDQSGWLASDELIDDLAPGVSKDGGDGIDGNGAIFVYAEFGEEYGALVFGDGFFEHWGEHLAWTAPPAEEEGGRRG